MASQQTCDRKRPARAARTWHSAAMMLAVCFAVAAGTATLARAQSTSLPGLVVTIPTTPEAEKKPEAKPAKPAVKLRKPAKKAKRRPTRRSASNARGPGVGRGRRSPHKIALLVNDDPITNFEIDQRARLLSLRVNVTETAKRVFGNLLRNPATNENLKAIFQRTIRENQGRSKAEILAIFEKRKRAYAISLQKRALSAARRTIMPTMRKKAEKELIDERLKLQAARELNIRVDKARVEKIFADIAKRNKLTPQQFAKRIRMAGGSPSSMKQRFKVSAAWSMVIQRRFRRYVTVNQRQVDQFLGTQPETSKQTLHVHKITFPVPSSLDQRAIAERFQRAERLRKSFRNCQMTKALAATDKSSKFRDLGSLDSSKIAEPTRSMLLAANNNEMLPPNISSEGIVLYAVCNKTSGKSDDKKIQRARATLQAKELQILAERHLADLRREAHIERR